MRARTMIYLEKRQMEELKRRARREGVSLAELVRRAVDRYLKPERVRPKLPRDPLEDYIGSFSSDLTDVSERHDYYIGEALYREYIEHSD